MKFRFTDQSLGFQGECPEQLLPPPGELQAAHYDTRNFGLSLGVRVGKTGRRSFFLWYRFDDGGRKDTLKPPYPSLSISAAINEAKSTGLDIQSGRDPQKENREPRRHIFKREKP